MKILKKRGRKIVFLIVLMLVSVQISFGIEKCPTLYPIIVRCDKCKFGFAEGYIDYQGNIIVKPKFEEAQEFRDRVGIIRVDDDTFGIVNLRGRLTLFPKFTVPVSSFSNGVAIAAINGKYGIIDKTGNPVTFFPFEVDNSDYRPGTTTFSDALAGIPIRGGGISFVDKTGKVVINLKMGFKTGSGFKDGIATVMFQGGDYGVIDKAGSFIVTPSSPTKMSISDPSEGLVKLFKDMDDSTKINSYEYINKEGKIVLKVFFDYAGDFVEGLAQIAKGKKWGYMNRKGEVIIPPQFDQTSDFSEGLAAVSLNGKYGFINQKGNFVTPLRFDLVNSSFECGLAYVQKNSFEGYINKQGGWVWKKKVSF